jgi:hypothetical protein
VLIDPVRQNKAGGDGVGLFGFGKTREQNFWTWFEKNQAKLFNFEQARDRIFDELQMELHKVCRELTFEFSPILDGKREFVVSAEGIKGAFPAVEQLVNCAPNLPQWKFVKFRQRRNPISDLQIGGTKVKASEVEVCIAKHAGKVGLIVFVPRIQDKKALAQYGFLFLDEALGEYDVSMKVGAIEFHPATEHPEYPRFPLTQLPERFDRAHGELTRS